MEVVQKLKFPNNSILKTNSVNTSTSYHPPSPVQKTAGSAKGGGGKRRVGKGIAAAIISRNYQKTVTTGLEKP
jgi:hypothetical protein